MLEINFSKRRNKYHDLINYVVINLTRIAAVVDDEGKIKKLPDGKWIIVYDTNKKLTEKYENPGYYAQTSRRLQTTLKMIELKVEAVLVPPQGFCRRSHDKAKESMRFILINENEKFDNLISKIPEMLEHTLFELPDDMLSK